jgi:hypothetical protein
MFTEQVIGTEKEKCALDLINSVKINLGNFSSPQQEILLKLLQRPDLHTSLVSESGIFRLHFDTTGTNAPQYISGLTAFENAMQVLEALDSTYNFEVSFLGYLPPPADFGEGGDDLYDIYIMRTGYYGSTTPENIINQEQQTYTSYMDIDPEFGAGFFTRGINAMQVTIAHELHHAIQLGNYINRISSDRFFYELSSTAMEEFVYDDVNDYYQYLNSYFLSPETSLPLTIGYNSVLWNIFLQNNFDYDILKLQWELMPSIRAMFAISNSLFEYESSFAREFNKFGIWMFFTSYRTVPGSYFEEAGNYPLVKQTSIIQFNQSHPPLEMTSRAAAHTFITFSIQSMNDSLVTIVSNGDVQSAVTDLSSIFNFQYTLFSDSSSGGRFLTGNYSSDFSADNPAFWSVSEILNNVVVREDDNVVNPGQTRIEYAYPSPFQYGKSYLFGSNIFIPLNANLAETVDFNIYTSGMNLLFQSEEIVKFLPGEQVGIIWNVLDQSGDKLASGVYIYVIKKGDDITKGKLVIFN